MAKTELVYDGDGEYIVKNNRIFTLSDSVKQAIKGGTEVVDNLESTSTTAALSANQGRILKSMIDDLKGLGHFISLWNSSTGLPVTDPKVSPYSYHTGDYYIISQTGDVNYRPSGRFYVSGIASTEIETESIKPYDIYLFDGNVWILLSSKGGGSVDVDAFLSLTSINPVQNKVITAELNKKANISSLKAVAFSNDYNDLDNLPEIPEVDVVLNEEFSANWRGVTDKAPSADVLYSKLKNINIPTKVSELENDAGYLSSTNAGVSGQVLTKNSDGTAMWTTVQGGGGNPDVALTQEEWDDLPDEKYSNNVTYFVYSNKSDY